MGNLPVSRTENCVTGAPVNHNLINEIQDVLVALYGTAIQDMHSMALAQPGTQAGSTSTITDLGSHAVVLQFGSATVADDYLPIRLPVGATLTAWNVWLQKVTTAGTISFKAYDANATNNAVSQIGATQSNNASNPGFIQLGQSGLSTVIQAGHAYHIAARSAGNTGGTDFVYAYSVTYLRPNP